MQLGPVAAEQTQNLVGRVNGLVASGSLAPAQVQENTLLNGDDLRESALI